jgi:ATP-binding cassette subfamily F protein uup
VLNEKVFSTQPVPTLTVPPASTRKKLSYLEAREYAGIEQRITEAEQIVQNKRVALGDPAIASDGPRLVAAYAELEAAQKDLDTLFTRWAELQEKADSMSPR